MANTLVKLGFDVLLVGRKKKDSLRIASRVYHTKRFVLMKNKGPFFYAEYNMRLFFFLLFKKVDILVSNDLDTLLPNYLVHLIKRIPLTYDSHEYFTGVPELINRKRIRNIWLGIEKRILPKLENAFTVNDSIASLYNQAYSVNMQVVRNVPYRQDYKKEKTKKELDLPDDKKLILLQGAGINIDRGFEEMILAMHDISEASFLIIGGGDVLFQLKELVKNEKLQSRVIFIPKLPFEKLFQYTVHADIGLAIDKATNINYKYSLPNKLFDYIQARVPVLCSDLPEITKIIKQYDIGDIIESHEPHYLSEKVKAFLGDTKKLATYKENLTFAASELCWEKEENKIINIYRKFV